MGILFVFVTCITGYLILTCFSGSMMSGRWIKISLAFPTGVAVSSLFFFLLNAGFNYRMEKFSSAALFFIIPLLLISIPGLKVLRTIRAGRGKHNHGSEPGGLRKKTGPEKVLLFIIIGVVLSCHLLLPMKNWDAFVYHLPFAEHIAETGNLPSDASPSYNRMTSAYPPMMFIYYALVWNTSDNFNLFIPRLICLMFALSLFMLQGIFGKEYLGWSFSRIFFIFIIELSCYSVWNSIIDENTDIPYTFFCFAGLYFSMAFLVRKDLKLLFVSSCFSSLACWTRYHGFVWIAVLTSSLIIYSIVTDRARYLSILKYMALCLVVPTIITAPFLIRNYLLYNNPVYPGFPSLMGGYQMSEWVLENIVPFYHPSGLFSGISLLTVLRLVFLLPVVLAVMESKALLKSNNSCLKHLGIIGILYFIAWLAVMIAPNSGDPMRFLLPALIIFSFTGSEFWFKLAPENVHKQPGKFISIYVILFLLLQLLSITARHYSILVPFHDYFPISMLTPVSFKKILYIFFAVIKNYFWIWMICFLALFKYSRTGFNTSPNMILRSLFYLVIIGSVCLPSLHSIVSVHQKQPGTWWWTQMPILEPGGKWIDENLPDNAVLLSFEDRKFIVPRKIFPADSPELQPIYLYKTPLHQKLKILNDSRITHLLVTGSFELLHPLFRKSQIFHLHRNPYLIPVYQHGKTLIFEIVYPTFH